MGAFLLLVRFELSNVDSASKLGSLSLVLGGPLVLSCALSSVVLARWLAKATHRSSVASLVGCTLGAAVTLPAALIVGLVVGGNLGIGWGERLINGKTGALIGLYIGFSLLATSCMVVGGLIGAFLGDRLRLLRAGTLREP